MIGGRQYSGKRLHFNSATECERSEVSNSGNLISELNMHP